MSRVKEMVVAERLYSRGRGAGKIISTNQQLSNQDESTQAYHFERRITLQSFRYLIGGLTGFTVWDSTDGPETMESAKQTQQPSSICPFSHTQERNL